MENNNIGLKPIIEQPAGSADRILFSNTRVKLILFLILPLIFLALLFMVFFLSKENPAGKTTVLRFSPDPLILKPGLGQNLLLNINTTSNVTAVQFALNFDPNVIEISSISPAGFFEKPNVLSEKIDNAKGSAFYALGSFNPKSGRGTLVSISVKAIGRSQKTKIDFDEETAVSALNRSDSVLKNAQGVQVIISSPTRL